MSLFDLRQRSQSVLVSRGSRESGATLISYALLVSLVALIGVSSIRFTGTAVRRVIVCDAIDGGNWAFTGAGSKESLFTSEQSAYIESVCQYGGSGDICGSQGGYEPECSGG
ncbi:MAG: hypothetical protein KDD64_11285 [Bdellovibrionales bacterium]|nr:hypothetical protein [Bdellovibrionales bacterium]